MNFLALARTRKQTYGFSRRPISNTTILKILEAARWAPSCGNSQPWRFIIVKDQKRINHLVKETYFAHYPFINPLPPILIAFVLNTGCIRKEPVCSDSREIALEDGLLCVAMAVMNSLLEAEARGISSCILTPRGKDSLKILRLQKEDKLVLFVGFGYEEKDAFQVKRYRAPLNELVSYEWYGRKQ
ncbi:nitroreductase family protein [Candidatus Woesearchaeota archaeon]|nr:nitroreductase family protein [Candidatus Woesearchaeota archaeon]